MSFSNKVIMPIRENKPHIVKLGGLWRVSQLKWKNSYVFSFRERWEQAHTWTNRQNDIIRAEQQAAKERQRERKRKKQVKDAIEFDILITGGEDYRK